MKKKIMLVTSTRADWGLLRPLALRIEEREDLSLFLVATGTHLLREYGYTLDEIIRDGFVLSACPDIMERGRGECNTALTIAGTIREFTPLIAEQKPDMAVLLGDRYEIFRVAVAASALSVPIAHISGGDVTWGAKDDFYRHCITKMASLHFPSCADSAKRLIQLGEDPETVFNFGGLGNENIKETRLLTLRELEEFLGISPLCPFALITLHPETRTGSDLAGVAGSLFESMEKRGLKIVATGSNADRGGKKINDTLKKLCRESGGRAKFFMSLGAKRYLSCLKYARLEAGNSSSGVVETPVYKTPAVNIGDRQGGRYIPRNVINCPRDPRRIDARVERALSEDFLKVCRGAENPYDAGVKASRCMAREISKFLSSPAKIKKFRDIDFDI